MRRLTLQAKAFIALATLLAALLLIFVGFSWLGLQRGLGPFVAEIELGRMDWLARRLQTQWAQDGNWDALRTQPALWRQMRQLGDGPPRPGAPGFGPPPEFRDMLLPHTAPPPAPPPDPSSSSIASRLGLLDAQGRLVAGAAPDPDGARLALYAPAGEQSRPQKIGELVLAPPPGQYSESNRAFLARQMGFVALTGLAGLVLALLLSAWLARRWLGPLAALVEGARGIAAGQLGTRVAVQGDAEFTHLARTFNDMAAQLADMEASRHRWLADVAHELRTPLAAMRAEIEAVQDGVRHFDDKTALRLHRQVMRLIQLVADLRESLDTAAPASPSARVPVHPLSILGEALANMAPRFAQAGLTLEHGGIDALATRPPVPLVLGDAQQLHQVFLNLLENSLRYTDAGGRLQVTATPLSWLGRPALQLRWDDTAPGVPEAELPRLFERLYRAEASRQRTTGDLGGSGLGLAICRNIVQAHGGRIEASASPLGGLRLTLWLPLLENPA
ncbi:MAG: ATP-binding protein [Acidovorax sp.]